MPFDGTTAQIRSLADIVRSLGKEPISMDDLATYKQQQLATHRGNRFYQHPESGIGLMFLMIIIGMVSLLSSIPVNLVGFHTAALAMLIAGAGGMVCLLLGVFPLMVGIIKVKSPAKWISHYASGVDDLSRHDVPAPIAKLVADVMQQAPKDAYITIGELYQERVMIDPYVTVSVPGSTPVCLGIWDGRRIVKMPTDIAR